jgi:hypothetical protein
MEFDFDRYIAAFNANDEDHLDEFFTEDLVVEGPDRTITGRAEWLGLLKFLHNGVNERLEPIMVLQQGDKVMVETYAYFTSQTDRPDFMQGPLLAGQPMKMRFFAAYWLRGHQIARLDIAWWPFGLREA